MHDRGPHREPSTWLVAVGSPWDSLGARVPQLAQAVRWEGQGRCAKLYRRWLPSFDKLRARIDDTRLIQSVAVLIVEGLLN